MYTHKLSVVVGLSVLWCAAFAQESPGLGKDVSADEIAAADFAILPNGDGLPEGSGTAAVGATVYQQYCFACHGEKGTGGINDTLAGGHGSLTSDR